MNKPLNEPPTEIEIASLLNDINMLPAGRDILRRLIYQRDMLLMGKSKKPFNPHSPDCELRKE